MMKHTINGNQIKNSCNINNIIYLLKQNCINSKKMVLDLLENASVEDLLELRWSVTEIINKKKGNVLNEK